jgi:hypothetical protein
LPVKTAIENFKDDFLKLVKVWFLKFIDKFKN